MDGSDSFSVAGPGSTDRDDSLDHGPMLGPRGALLQGLRREIF
jgi:hypothetical protein